LGFVRAVVLGYTVPGSSEKIAYRLREQEINFNTIDFTVDRYQLDNVYTENYDISANAFLTSEETTFDRYPGLSSSFSDEGSVNYAVSLAFDQINQNPITAIQSLGGMDGVNDFQDGDTIIFLQQEDYSPVLNPFIITNVNDGWNYPDGTVVPGFVEKDRGLSIINYRAGIWRVTITTPESVTVPTQSSDFGNDLVGFDTRQYDFSIDWATPPAFPTQVVTLEFVEEVIPGEQVQINGGTTRGQSILFYDSTLQPNRSVPEYAPVTYQTGVVRTFTKFDNNGTKFFSRRDTYSVPEFNNKYLKFPKIGVFK
jgi:hypothetical protein